jgi:hypothetical protein
MSLREDITHLLAVNSLSELTREMSLVLGEKSERAFENGDMIYGEQLKAAADHFWQMDNYGL